MKQVRLRTLLFLAPVLACSQETTQGPGTNPAGGAGGVADSDAPAVEVNNSKPIPLDEWRQIQADGKKAVRTQDLAMRIKACQTFVASHPDHQEAANVLEALTDSLVESGDFDPAELAKFCEQRVGADKDNESLPVEVVRNYHLKHNLPTESALRLIKARRDTLVKDRKELELEDDERRKERKGFYITYRETEADVIEGRLHLERNNNKKALEVLAAARKRAAKFPKDIEIRSKDGKVVRTLASSGLMDQLNVLSATAHLRMGDKKSAQAALNQTLGFLSELKLRELYEDTRDKLGMAPKAAQTVKGAASPAQKFKLKDINGKTVKLEDYKGKVVMLAFWATWCGPCKKELPELQKFYKENKKKGVELLAISIDSFQARPQIKPFLKKANLDIPVALEEPEQLSQYSYQAIPALYVIDREGKIAHARTGYDPDLKDKLKSEIKEIVEGKRDSGRELMTVEQAPTGFGIRWQAPMTGGVQAVAIASPIGKAGGQVGTVGQKGLTRFDAAGKKLGTKPVQGWTRGVRSADLDKNGAQEWILAQWGSVKVIDGEGEVYWEKSVEGMAQIAGIRDLNGDGFQEIVLKENDRVVAMKSVPEALWKSRPFKDLDAAVLAPGGGVVVQADGELVELDESGNVRSKGTKAPKGRTLTTRVKTANGEVDFFKGSWDPEPITDHDLDGDGQNDIVIPSRRGVIAYDQSGKPILRVRSNDVGLTVGVGDLDGKPGAEIAVFVEHYGLVLLGKK